MENNYEIAALPKEQWKEKPIPQKKNTFITEKITTTMWKKNTITMI